MRVDVGGEDLDLETLFQGLDMLLQQDGDGIGLLPCGAAADPDPYLLTHGLAGKELRDNLLLEGGKGLRVAEEVRNADQQIAKESLRLLGCLPQIAQVVLLSLDLVDSHTPLHPADKGVVFILGEIVAGPVAQQDAYLFQVVFTSGPGVDRPADPLGKCVGGIGNELGRHLGWSKDVICKAGGDNTARHAVIRGGIRVLCHYHAALDFYRSHPLRTIASGTGENDADGPFMQVLGQRSKKEIDEQALPARCGRLQQLKAPPR